MVGQCEGNSSEDEFGVLCGGVAGAGSITVRNVTCARNDKSFREKALRTLQCELEKLEPHARE